MQKVRKILEFYFKIEIISQNFACIRGSATEPSNFGGNFVRYGSIVGFCLKYAMFSLKIENALITTLFVST